MIRASIARHLADQKLRTGRRRSKRRAACGGTGATSTAAPVIGVPSGRASRGIDPGDPVDTHLWPMIVWLLPDALFAATAQVT